MTGSYPYQVKDEARRLYMEDDWSLKEIAVKYDLKEVSPALIPIYMREQRDKYEIAKKSKAKHTALRRAKYIKWYEAYYKGIKAEREELKAVRLNKTDAAKVQKMAQRTQKDNAVKMIKQHKQCPINNWLTGAR